MTTATENSCVGKTDYRLLEANQRRGTFLTKQKAVESNIK